MPAYRKERLEEAIKRVVADSLMKDIKDPRIGFVTVTRVELSNDKSIANVYVSVLGDDKAKRNSMAGLDSAKGYVKYKVGKNIKIRNVPAVRFFLDRSIEYGTDMVNLLNTIEEERTEKDNHLEEPDVPGNG